MENRQVQYEAFLKTLDLVHSTGEEREHAIRGFDIFFDKGWPTNFFTAGMALRAGAGLIPAAYDGFASEAKYKARMAAEDAK